MSWNYRVVKRHEPAFHDNDANKCDGNCIRYGVHEAFCDKKGKVFAITVNPIGIRGESLEELKKDLEWHAEALKHPVLDYDDIPEDGAEHPLDKLETEEREPLTGGC